MAIAPHPTGSTQTKPVPSDQEEHERLRYEKVSALVALLVFAAIMALVIVICTLGGLVESDSGMRLLP